MAERTKRRERERGSILFTSSRNEGGEGRGREGGKEGDGR